MAELPTATASSMKDQRTDGELNRIIAEWHGVVAEEGGDGFWYLFLRDRKLGTGAGLSFDHAWAVFCPHYCTDLNAIHEAEKKLGNDKVIPYVRFIGNLVESGTPLMFATARQRAEALVAVIESTKP